AAGEVGEEAPAVGGGAAAGVEDEVAQAVVDVGAAQVAAAEEDVGVGADDHVGAGRDQLGGEGALAVDGAAGQLPAPVEVDHHGVGRLPGRADRGQEARLLVGRGQAGLVGAGGPGRGQVAVEDLGGADHGDALALDRDQVGPVGLL